MDWETVERRWSRKKRQWHLENRALKCSSRQLLHSEPARCADRNEPVITLQPRLHPCLPLLLPLHPLQLRSQSTWSRLPALSPRVSWLACPPQLPPHHSLRMATTMRPMRTHLTRTRQTWFRRRTLVLQQRGERGGGSRCCRLCRGGSGRRCPPLPRTRAPVLLVPAAPCTAPHLPLPLPLPPLSR